jgi:ABC-type transport system involved in multi-copper enzyme maturation permease subunit
MLQAIIKKEFQQSIQDLRFLSALSLTLLLLIASVWVLADIYRAELNEYHSRVKQQDDFIDHYGHYNRGFWMSQVQREPGFLQPLVLGLNRDAEQKNFVSNPLPVLFNRLDFVTIVTVIMSLFAVLFSYNAVSGEKEAGLLKLLLASGVRRRDLFFGKLIGGAAGLLIPFTFSMLCTLLFMMLAPAIHFSLQLILIFFLLLFAALLYILVFYAIGLFFSCRCSRSNVAVVKALFVWVFLVLVTPNIAPFLAARFYSTPSATQVDQQTVFLVDIERDKIVEQRNQELIRQDYPDMRMVRGMSKKELDETLQSDSSFKQRYVAYQKTWQTIVDQVNAEQRSKAEKINNYFKARSHYQEKLSAGLACLSPLAEFTLLAVDLTESGLAGADHWAANVNEYETLLDAYLEKRWESASKQNPSLTVNDYLDMRDRPRFQYHPQPLSRRIMQILPYGGALLAYLLFFILAGMVSFDRYDVR